MLFSNLIIKNLCSEYEWVGGAGGFLGAAPQPAEEEAPGQDRRSDRQNFSGSQRLVRNAVIKMVMAILLH
jgi:hypothetical protein